MPSLHWQLEAIRGEIQDNKRHAHELAASVTDEQWMTRPEPDRWSMAECVIHLNLTSAAMLASLNAAIAAAPSGKQPRRYRRDPIGWMLCWTMEPPVRKQFPTTAPFLPQRADSKESTLAEFDAQHA
ncbi:MAG: DinB family protein, partial [Gemmatimonadota bacterium]